MDSHVLARPGHRLARALAVAIVVAALAVLVTPGHAHATTNDLTVRMENGFVGAINTDRAAAGLSQLPVNEGARAQARAWAEHLASTKQLAHDKNLAGEFAMVAPGFTAGAENVGYGVHPWAINLGFVQSGVHRANMMGGWSQVAVGVATSPDGTIWVVERFIR